MAAPLSEALYFSGDEFFRDLILEIEKSEHTIEMEFYIFNLDQLGNRLVEELVKAAVRGVSVRLLVDAFGSFAWTREDIETARQRGVEVQLYNAFAFKKLLSGDLVSPFETFNRRNHRKTCIIDNSVAFVGSMNVTSDHLAEFKGRLAWRDTGVRVVGDVVKMLSLAFEQSWAPYRNGENSYQTRSLCKFLLRKLRLNSSRFLRTKLRADLIDKLKSANERIWVTNPYFSPDPRVLSALKSAARRGVDVKMLAPREIDIPFMKWVASSYYKSLLKSGVKIYEYIPSVLHAKTIIIDKWATVGTSNLNRRSWLHDLEADIVLQTFQGRHQLQKQFEQDLDVSEEIFIDKMSDVSLRYLLGRFFLVFKYWL